jgi:hypothetical protein
VGYGDRTVEEMSHAWVNITYMDDAGYEADVAKRRANESNATQQQQ